MDWHSFDRYFIGQVNYIKSSVHSNASIKQFALYLQTDTSNKPGWAVNSVERINGLPYVQYTFVRRQQTQQISNFESIFQFSVASRLHGLNLVTHTHRLCAHIPGNWRLVSRTKSPCHFGIDYDNHLFPTANWSSFPSSTDR